MTLKSIAAWTLKIVSIISIGAAILFFLGGSFGVAVGEADPVKIQTLVYKALGCGLITGLLGFAMSNRRVASGNLLGSIVRAFLALLGLLFLIMSLSLFMTFFYEGAFGFRDFLIWIFGTAGFGSLAYACYAAYKKIKV